MLEPTLLGGGKQMVMGTLIQTQFGGGRNWPFGAAIAVLLMVLVIGLAGILLVVAGAMRWGSLIKFIRAR